MKVLTILLATCALSACGTAPSASSTRSSVNNGETNIRTVAQCDTAGYKLDVVSVNGASYMGSFLIDGAARGTNLRCTKAKAVRHHGADFNTALYDCTEARAGDGLITSHIYRQGLSGAVLAEVSIGQMFPLPPKHLTTMLCTTAR